jgi:hypothetical protein
MACDRSKRKAARIVISAMPVLDSILRSRTRPRKYQRKERKSNHNCEVVRFLRQAGPPIGQIQLR